MFFIHCFGKPFCTPLLPPPFYPSFCLSLLVSIPPPSFYLYSIIILPLCSNNHPFSRSWLPSIRQVKYTKQKRVCSIYLSEPGWPHSLYILPLSSTYLQLYYFNFSTDEENSIAHIHYTFIIHSLVAVHLDWFHSLAIVSRTEYSDYNYQNFKCYPSN